jgi:CubicO group peptidase (beta-lactamase class C family)
VGGRAFTPDRRALTSARVRAVLAPGLAAGEYLGAQAFASVAGEPLVDLALGDARIGIPMTTDTLVSWQCNTKPVTATAVALLWERGALDPDDYVVSHLPGFGANGKAAVTLRHLLEHSAGFTQDPPLAALGVVSPEKAEALVCASRLMERWWPGMGTLYSSWLGYATLGAIVARVSGRPFSRFVRDEIFLPLGMDDCWIGVDEDREEEVAGRTAFLYDTAGGAPVIPVIGPVAKAQGLTTFSPGSGGIGPMNQLARLYESLVGAGHRTRLLRSETVDAMTRSSDARGLRTYGLGFGVRPGAFAPSCPAAFGHVGLRSSLVCAHRARRVVVAVMVNGLGRGRGMAHLTTVVDAVFGALDELGRVEHSA